ncbi:MAG: hypothetical protein KatS3mg110_2964 [Pirellulaceae bacterium]|nr:MAG: hypothetical protein KatS3mg110_2964 [Pirellulaceae bacterium]
MSVARRKWTAVSFIVAALLLWAAGWSVAQNGSASKQDVTASEEPSPADVAAESQPGAVSSVSLDKLAANLTIFVLAIFVGFEVITKVPPTLHTPLMSGSNAISGITIVGAIAIAGTGAAVAERWVGFFAVVLAMINVVGGFVVTHRMLMMFKKK